jgi:hypothetical protein
MDFTLDQVLTIIGRLDDRSGFDTPRERFRRFLNDRMTSVESARVFIQQCRERAGQQSHRALQDALALSGRFLGFDTTFGRYEHEAGTMPIHGAWQSRRHMHATLIVCTDQITDIDLDIVSRAIVDAEGAPTPRIALLVVTSFYAAKDRLERSVAEGKHPNVRLCSLSGLLRLCEMTTDGRLVHHDVLQLLNPGLILDPQIDLLERAAATSRREPPPPSAGVAAPATDSARDDRRYWVNGIRLDPFTPTERIVRSLIATHQILGSASGLEDRVRAGDGLFVFIADRGIVAHAQIAGILSDGSKIVRDSQQFTHVLQLRNVTVFDAPVSADLELALRLDLALAGDASAVTLPISAREFESIASQALST